VSVLLGDAQSLLRAGVRLDVASGLSSTQVADFNRDGVDDLVVTSSRNNKVFVLPGLGGGFFNDTQPFVYETGSSPGRTLVGQFDSSPGMDLVTLNFGSSNLTFYSGFSAGERVDVATGGSGPIDAALADFNFDGSLDLVVAHNGDSSLGVLLGSADGFALFDTVLAADVQNPTAIALAEIGDGELGLLVVSEGDESVAVFNRTALVPDSTSPAFDAPQSFLASFANTVLDAALGSFSGSVPTVFSLLVGAALNFLSTPAAEGDDVSGASRGVSMKLWEQIDAWVTAGTQWLVQALGIPHDMQKGPQQPEELLKELLEMVLPVLPWKSMEEAIKQFTQPQASAERPSRAELVDTAIVDEDLAKLDADGEETPTDDGTPVRVTAARPADDAALPPPADPAVSAIERVRQHWIAYTLGAVAALAGGAAGWFGLRRLHQSNRMRRSHV
jgi:hypothetical protein